MGKSRAAAFALGAYDEGASLDVGSLDSDFENPMAEGMLMLSYILNICLHIQILLVLTENLHLSFTFAPSWYCNVF